MTDPKDPPPARELPIVYGYSGSLELAAYENGRWWRRAATTTDIAKVLAALPDAERAALLAPYMRDPLDWAAMSDALKDARDSATRAEAKLERANARILELENSIGRGRSWDGLARLLDDGSAGVRLGTPEPSESGGRSIVTTHARARQIVEGRPPGPVRDELLAYIDAAEQNERLAKVVREHGAHLLDMVTGNTSEHCLQCQAAKQALADALKGGT